MRLQLIYATWRLLAVLLLVSRSSPARAEVVEGKLVAEIGGYQDTTWTSVLTPSIGGGITWPDSGIELEGGYLVDVVSTASPDIVATASPRWEEVRHGAHLGFRYKPDRYGFAVRAATSYAPDYLSAGGSTTALFETADRVSTFSIGAAYHRDVIGRTGTPFSIFSHAVDEIGFTAGWTGVLNRSTLLTIITDGTYETGDPSKPYRYIPIFSPQAAERIEPGASAGDVATLRSPLRPLEQLPEARIRGSATARVAWRSPPVTLRFEERVYADTWRLLASTTDGRLPVDVHERVRLWPHVRLHAQSGVSFWDLAYVAERREELPALRTGDRELGPLVNVGAGGGARFALGDDTAAADIGLSVGALGTFTRFFEALYVVDRGSILVTIGLEATW